MPLIGQTLSSIAGLGMLVCFILLIVKMFQRGQAVMAIVCIVLFFCCLLGHFIAFIYGWVKYREWNISNLMIIWSICIVIWLIGGALAPPDFSQLSKLGGQ